MHILKYLILLFFFFSSNSYCLEKISYFDLNEILDKSDAGKSLLIQLNEINKQNIEILKKDELKIKSLEEEIKINQNVFSSDELKKKIDIFNKELNKMRIKKDNLVEEFAKLRNKEIMNFMNIITPIIEKYMEKNSIVMIIDKKNIFIAKSNYDITNDIIFLINQSIKDFKIDQK